MKTLFIFLLVSVLNIYSLCFAFEPPDESRWHWIDSNDKLGVWVDTQTIKFKQINNSYSQCNGHRTVDAWFMMYHSESDTVLVSNDIYDLNCRTYKTLQFVKYDSSNNIIDSFKFQYPEVSNIVPGSWGEVIFDTLNSMWYFRK